MDRKQKKSLRRHLLYIYIGYFVALLLGFFHGFAPNFLTGFSEGMKAGEEVERFRQNGQADERVYFLATELKPSNEAWESLRTADTTLRADIEFTHALIRVHSTARTDAGTVHQIDSVRHTLLFFLPAILAKLAILVLVAMIINILRKSVRDEQTLPKRIITYTRIVAALLVLAVVLSATGSYMYSRASEVVLQGTGLEAANHFPINYWNIFMAILVLFSAEVFSIGTQLSEEQKLTI